MSFAGRCYSLEEAASRKGDDERRNLHHILLMLQSGRPGQRCHLLGDVIPLQKQRAGMEMTTEEMNSKAKISVVGRCYSLEEAACRSGDDDRTNVHHIILMLQSGAARRRCHLLGDVIPLKKQRAGMEMTTEEIFIISF
ncbi:hypothetical protein CDAR_196441 [Caerostris darwini]|uniref:Uncharacterized protein n=1 Tax=Caerostris darwini TaxID=1538125 RepID=A0AAV4PZR6_9ARAC|nr:hypothetical protein CDAR_196441 [Caerostris darwini]